jgi:hypothetical protein
MILIGDLSNVWRKRSTGRDSASQQQHGHMPPYEFNEENKGNTPHHGHAGNSMSPS